MIRPAAILLVILAAGTAPAMERPVGDPPARRPAQEGAACGGIAGIGCAGGLFCDHAPSDRCGAADRQGTCRPVPDFCTAQYDPVCGCDGETYGNSCEAARAGVAVAAAGACSSPEQ